MAFGSVNMVRNPKESHAEAESPYLNKTDAESMYLKKTGDTLEGDINANGKFVTGLPSPVDESDAVPKAYLEHFVEENVNEAVEKIDEEVRSEVEKVIKESIGDNFREGIGIYVQDEQPSVAEKNDVWIDTSDNGIFVYKGSSWDSMSNATELEKTFVSYIKKQTLTVEQQKIALENINAVEREEKVSYTGATSFTIEDNKYYFVTDCTDITLTCDAEKSADCRGWITFGTRGSVTLNGFEYVDDPDNILEAGNNTKWEFNISCGCAIFKKRSE